MRNITYILYCLCSIFIYSSCNHQKKKLEEERTLDSIVIEEKHNREIEDSIKTVMLKDLSLIAWGDTKFGMTFQEVKNSRTFNNCSQSDSILFVSRDSTFIGGHQFSNIYADFYNNALYKININSGLKTLDEFDILLKIVEILRKKVQSKYGEPSFIEKDKEYVSSQLLDKNSVVLFNWDIMEKRINISIQHEMDNYFSINCLIYNNILMSERTESITNNEKKTDAGGF